MTKFNHTNVALKDITILNVKIYYFLVRIQ